MLNETLRSHWFSAGLHAGLWLLLVLAATSLGGRRPPFAEEDAVGVTAPAVVPVARLEKLFAPDQRSGPVQSPDSPGVFATTHFQPPIKPVVPPTTQRVELTYQGYFEADGPRRAMLRLADAIVAVPVGDRVVTNLWVAEAAFKTLTLTNSAGATNVLALNVKKTVEVPLP